MSQNDNEEAVLTIEQLTERWHTTRKVIYDAIHAGRLKAFKLGKRWYRVSMEEVRRFELATSAA